MLWRLLAVLLALALQLAGTYLLPTFPLLFDLPMLPVLLVAAEGQVLLALLLATGAGLATDALSGGLFGLHGFSGTVAAYVIALLAGRVMLRGSSAIALAAAIGAALKQATLVGLGVFLFATPEPPQPIWPLLTIATTTLLVLSLHLLLRRLLGKRVPPRVADLRLD